MPPVFTKRHCVQRDIAACTPPQQWLLPLRIVFSFRLALVVHDTRNNARHETQHLASGLPRSTLLLHNVIISNGHTFNF